MTDKNGNRVEVRNLDGRPTFLVTDRHGYVLHGARVGTPDPRTVEDLVSLGVDLGSLV